MNGCGAGTIEIGVFCHEFGHAFGLPDLYDGSGSSGIGHWGLMGSGNWNTPTNPAHFDAWCKSQLGWIVPTEVGPVSMPYSIHSSEMNAEAYKLDIMEEKFSRTNVNPIAGSWSMHCMLTSAEAAARHWPGGAGYGNGWDEAVVRQFAYNGSNPVNLQFDCAYSTETGYDFGLVKIDVNGTVSTLRSFDGSGSSHASIDLTPYLNGSGATSYTLMFQFVSDSGYSDEDGLWNSGTNGAFQFDNVSVIGGGGELCNRVRDVRGRVALRPDEESRQGVLSRGEPEHGRRAVRPGSSWPRARHLPRRAGRGDDVARKHRRFGEQRDPRDDARGSGQSGPAPERNESRRRGDVFPGTANNTTFNSATAPSSNSHNSYATNVAAEAIGSAGATMTANLRGGYFAPTAASISPNSGSNNEIVSITDLLGGGFVYGAVFPSARRRDERVPRDRREMGREGEAHRRPRSARYGGNHIQRRGP